MTTIPLSSDTSIPVLRGTNTLDERALANRQSGQAATVFLYRHGPDGWHHVSSLTHAPPAPDDQFGRAIAFGRDLLVVGAPGAGDVTIFTAAPP